MRFSLNRWLGLGVLAIAVVSLIMIAGCAGKDGAVGRDGTQGLQGIQGPPGPDGCTTKCHTDDFSMADFLLPTVTDFDLSQHNQGDTYARSTNPCSRCHTNEGFQKFVATGEVGVISNSSHIGCFTCHAPHTNKTFDLRKTGVTKLDVSGADYDKGKSNTCAVCHQARTPDPAITDATKNITSSRWGPHHGPQANVLSGNGAYVFSSQSAYATSHPHNSPTATFADGCVSCHMAPTASESTAGRHTFRVGTVSADTLLLVNATGCAVTGCHEGKTDAQMTTKVKTRDAVVAATMAQIKAKLVSNGWLNPATDLLITPGPVPADDRGAIFNYLLIESDLSEGVHNPTYVDDVLAKTKTYLGL